MIRDLSPNRQHLPLHAGLTGLTFDVIIARMAAWSAVNVPRKSYEFPALCPDCLRMGPLTGVLIPADLRIEVPFCEACAGRQLKWRKLGRPLMILAVVIAFVLTLWFDLSKWGRLLACSDPGITGSLADGLPGTRRAFKELQRRQRNV